MLSAVWYQHVWWITLGSLYCKKVAAHLGSSLALQAVQCFSVNLLQALHLLLVLCPEVFNETL